MGGGSSGAAVAAGSGVSVGVGAAAGWELGLPQPAKMSTGMGSARITKPLMITLRVPGTLAMVVPEGCAALGEIPAPLLFVVVKRAWSKQRSPKHPGVAALP